MTMPSGAQLDWSHALEAVRGNRGLLCSIVQTYLQEYPRRLEELKRAAGNREAKPLQLAAHSLKGPLRFFGAHRAFGLARQLEDLARNGRLGEAPAALVDLDIALTDLEPLLRDFLNQNKP
jgi:two-component system, sensor histidine kinase and response regulator